MRQVANICITTNPGPVEIMGLCRRHWNDLKEPSVGDLRIRVQKKKKKLRAKTQAAKKLAKKSSSAPSATSEPQVGPQDQAGDPSPATDQNPTEEEEVVMLGEVRQPSGQPNSVPGMAPPPPGVPIVRTPLLNFQQANPPQIGRVNPGVAQPRGLFPATPRLGRGNQHVQGRQRGGGYRGRKAMRSFSRGSRGGAPTNSGPQGVATNSQFRGNGRTDQGNFGNGPGFSWVYCWSCNTANPNQNQVCSYCYVRLF